MNDSKHLFVSKTFWANVLGLALTVGGLLPQKYAAPVLVIANIGLRLISNQPVNLFPKDGDQLRKSVQDAIKDEENK